MRLAVAMLAGAIACGVAPVASADCTVPGDLDGLLADLPGFTVEQHCPDLPSPFAGADVAASTAGEISRDGSPVLTLFAGELADGSATDYLDDVFLPAVPGTAIEPQNVGGYPVTYFNIAQLGDGYAYAQGWTVVIAYDTAWPQSASAAKEILPTLLSRIPPA